jgi:hypothetical protein
MAHALAAGQRPRRAVPPKGTDIANALAAAVAADAVQHVARGELDGPLAADHLRARQGSDVDPGAPVFTCLVERGMRGQYSALRS